jgi:hypothetical protein
VAFRNPADNQADLRIRNCGYDFLLPLCSGGRDGRGGLRSGGWINCPSKNALKRRPTPHGRFGGVFLGDLPGKGSKEFAPHVR